MRSFFILALLLTAVGAIRLSAEEPARKGAKLRLSTKEVFMGKSKAAETLIDSLIIYNDGDEELSIYSVFTGCSCTGATYPRSTIAPGDSIPLHLRFHDKRQPPGRFRKLLRIRSNDPSSPARFFITGVILPDRY